MDVRHPLALGRPMVASAFFASKWACLLAWLVVHGLATANSSVPRSLSQIACCRLDAPEACGSIPRSNFIGRRPRDAITEAVAQKCNCSANATVVLMQL
jgi:hypothetical protein